MNREWLYIKRPGDVADYAREIILLNRLGVPTRLVAQVFQTNSPYIRKIRSRGYTQPVFLPTPRITPWLKLYGPDKAQLVTMRASSEANYSTEIRTRHQVIAELMQMSCEDCRIRHRAAKENKWLRSFRMLSANAENPSALWLQAATHAFIGFAKIEVLDYEGAAASAKRGMGAAVKAFDSSLGDNIHLDMYAFAGRCAAYAAIRLCDVREARDVYEEAEAATIFSQGRTTPELLVLKALLSNHEGNDDDAIKYFDKARAQARADGEYPLNFRTRYMIDITPAVIEGRFDKVFELARESILNYGQGAYESWNAVLGAVVAAFMTDSEAAIACSIGLMRDAQSWSLSTIQMERRYFLLSFTPHLGLNLPQRREWLITI